jgi:peptide/nickel transport system permease protein
MSSAAVSQPVAARRARLPRVRTIFVGLSIGWLAIVAFVVVAGPLVAPRSPASQDLIRGLAGPSGSHLLGTDELGRDILSRALIGTRSPVLGALAIAFGAMILSVTFGLVAGYRGGRTESLVMRGIDLLLAMPALLVIIVVAGAFGGGYVVAVLLLIALSAPWDARIIRGVTLEQKPRAYVEAARVMRLSDRRVMFSHILPNVLPLVIVNACLDFTFGLVTLAALSFVGLGVEPGSADWGLMVFENRGVLSINPWAALAPALLIVATAVSANIVGDWLYERVDTKGRAR